MKETDSSAERELSQPLWNTQQYCDFIGESPRTAEGRRVDGTGPPFVRIGRSIRYQPSAVHAWLATRVRTSTSDPGPRCQE